MDQTRRSASVEQLQELAERIEKRLGESEKRQSETSAEAPDISSMVLGVQQLLDAKLNQAIADIKGAQVAPVDLTPILDAMKAQGAQIADLIATTAMLAQALTAPVERTGTAQLSDGTQVSIQITDRKQ